MYLENPKPEEGAEDDPAIMTSHIIRAPPVLCAQVGLHWIQRQRQHLLELKAADTRSNCTCAVHAVAIWVMLQ